MPGRQLPGAFPRVRGSILIYRDTHAHDVLSNIDSLDLAVTDPPYAFGGCGLEHELSATVATVLRETAKKLKRGSYLVVFCASSWRSISYMVESVRGIMQPVRIGTWTKPQAKTKVRTPGWAWASVSAVALRKGPKNRKELCSCGTLLDHISVRPLAGVRRAQLPVAVADWAVLPYSIPGGIFFDPFAGSGALVDAAERAGMLATGSEIQP